MVDTRVELGVEADDVLAGRDLGRLGVPTLVPRALVAAEVVVCDEVVVGGHEAIVMLADVLKGLRLDTVEHQVREEEMGRGERGNESNGSEGEAGEMHSEIEARRDFCGYVRGGCSGV